MSADPLERLSKEWKRLQAVESAAQWLVRSIVLPQNAGATVAQLREDLAHEIGVILPALADASAPSADPLEQQEEG